MIKKIFSLLNRVERQVPPYFQCPMPDNIPPGERVDVGCGETPREGFSACDLRPLPNVQYACHAWDLSKYCKAASCIHSRHMIEHLTFAELDATLKNWYNALLPEGWLVIVTPNLDYHIKQWKKARWTNSEWSSKWSNARYSAAGLYGWQRECDPSITCNDSLSSRYWDCHKSGYNSKSINFWLGRAGFRHIKVKVYHNVHLVAYAKKVL
jgi:hypothetical protein